MSDPNVPQEPQPSSPEQGRFAPPGSASPSDWNTPLEPASPQSPIPPQSQYNPGPDPQGVRQGQQGWGTPSAPPGYGQLPPYAGQAPDASYSGYQFGPKPPVIPFHPLTIGDLFQGTFAAIRSNPKVMFVFSIAVMAVVGLVAAIANTFVAWQFPQWIDWMDFDPGLDSNNYGPGAFSLPAMSIEMVVGLIQTGATMLIAGMLVLAVTNAVVGANRDLKGTWEQLKPKFWRLVGTSLLVGLIIGGVAVIGVIALFVVIATTIIADSSDSPGTLLGLLILLLIPIFIAVVLWLTVRLYFATMCTVVEDVSPTRALQRSWQLTKGSFWRVLGRLLLMTIVVGAASSVLTGAINMIFTALLGAANAPWALMFVVTSVVASLVTGLVQPVSASYNSLMYVDERIRKEGLGPRLQAALDANQ